MHRRPWLYFLLAFFIAFIVGFFIGLEKTRLTLPSTSPVAGIRITPCDPYVNQRFNFSICIPSMFSTPYDESLSPTPKEAMGHSFWDIRWFSSPQNPTYTIWIRVESNPVTDPANANTFGVTEPVNENNIDKVIYVDPAGPFQAERRVYDGRQAVRVEFGDGNMHGYQYSVYDKIENILLSIQVRSENSNKENILALDKVISTLRFTP